jgi:hypothetical protein
VFLVDVNVLLYAVNADAENHEKAHRWLSAALTSPTKAVGLSWAVLLAFLRISTHRAVFPTPLDLEPALQIVEEWLQMPPTLIVEPTQRHLTLLGGLLKELGVVGNLIPDAHLAALALEHRATIVSFDRDFGRFRGLDWVIPE